MLQVVWFKRDLRVADHAPLRAAASAGPVLALHLVEPSVWRAADASARQAAFARECLLELDRALRALGTPLNVAIDEALPVFERLRAAIGRFVLHSHEETGNAITFARDRAVARWCRQHGIEWREVPSNAVVRRLDDRDRWSRLWMQRMADEPLAPPGGLRDGARDAAARPASGVPPLAAWPCARQWLADGLADPSDAGCDAAQRQPGGREAALALLASFLAGRGRDYRRAMSSPLTAADACSRLSPHLAWGSVSIRETAHATWTARRALAARDDAPSGLRAALASFEGRLHWHCHFIQKLESEPAIEARNVHRAFDGLRNEGPLDAEERTRLLAWAQGRTGWPMVDACMRQLEATGWLNFRMRAMLLSVATGPLWLHWRAPGLALARRFVDYEPGIHWPQCQMQACVTGINATRLYHPVKQARDHDPEGAYVRRWVPELARVPAPWIFEPWTMPEGVQQAARCRIGIDYPAPPCEIGAALREARERLWAVRRTPQAREEGERVWARHGSRNPGREGVRRAKAAAGPRPGKAAGPDAARQLGLDFGPASDEVAGRDPPDRSSG